MVVVSVPSSFKRGLDFYGGGAIVSRVFLLNMIEIY